MALAAARMLPGQAVPQRSCYSH